MKGAFCKKKRKNSKGFFVRIIHYSFCFLKKHIKYFIQTSFIHTFFNKEHEYKNTFTQSNFEKKKFFAGMDVNSKSSGQERKKKNTPLQWKFTFHPLMNSSFDWMPVKIKIKTLFILKWKKMFFRRLKQKRNWIFYPFSVYMWEKFEVYVSWSGNHYENRVLWDYDEKIY